MGPHACNDNCSCRCLTCTENVSEPPQTSGAPNGLAERCDCQCPPSCDCTCNFHTLVDLASQRLNEVSDGMQYDYTDTLRADLKLDSGSNVQESQESDPASSLGAGEPAGTHLAPRSLCDASAHSKPDIIGPLVYLVEQDESQVELLQLSVHARDRLIVRRQRDTIKFEKRHRPTITTTSPVSKDIRVVITCMAQGVSYPVTLLPVASGDGASAGLVLELMSLQMPKVREACSFMILYKDQLLWKSEPFMIRVRAGIDPSVEQRQSPQLFPSSIPVLWPQGPIPAELIGSGMSLVVALPFTDSNSNSLPGTGCYVCFGPGHEHVRLNLVMTADTVSGIFGLPATLAAHHGQDVVFTVMLGNRTLGHGLVYIRSLQQVSHPVDRRQGRPRG